MSYYVSQICYSRAWALDVEAVILQQQLCCKAHQRILIPQAFSAPGAPAQHWYKCLCSHRMDWIDELIYPKLSLKKKTIWALFQLDQFPSSPRKQPDVTLGSSKHRKRLDSRKKCRAIGWILAYTGMSPNVNLQPSKREMQPGKYMIE